jgi:uncharacterized membrane protein
MKRIIISILFGVFSALIVGGLGYTLVKLLLWNPLATISILFGLFFGILFYKDESVWH